jgi:ribonuclease G
MGYVESNTVVCEANPELLQYIENDEKNLEFITRRTRKQIKLQPNDSLSISEYNIYPAR